MSSPRLTVAHKEIGTLTELQIAEQLTVLEVHFLHGGGNSIAESEVNPAKLLTALAMSHEARLRLALIPLLLQHPEFAIYACGVTEQLPQSAQVVLQCYYTAAQLLQQKYSIRLAELFDQSTLLPDLFTAELGLPTGQSPEISLQTLAERQRILSGRAINWLGTYEHGAQRLMKHLERRHAWRA